LQPKTGRRAYATGATIVTANADEFKRIRGLNVQNWLA
jgi:tRNA(fMet)-specific endonuclease VapC